MPRPTLSSRKPRWPAVSVYRSLAPHWHTASMAGRAKINAEIHERRVDLPSLPTALIGREHAVNQLAHRLAGHQGRLLTFVGAPGVGKTTLALAVATRVQAFYANGAIFVPLAAIADAPLMAIAVLVAAGAGDSGDRCHRAPAPGHHKAG